MSDKTRAKILEADLVTKEGVNAKLNFFINFDRFIEDHTGVNIGLWLKKIHKKDTINPSYILNH